MSPKLDLRQTIDFRKSINDLAALVVQGLGLDPFASALYVFRNRRCDRIKILGWERKGFWLLMKRLEDERFVWPRQDARMIELIDSLALSHGMRLADALIGATAIEHKATLITANIKHFSAVEGLAIEAFEP